ncbi:MAG: tRNA uracil 4-sulfurtransferase ThiI [Acidobacteriota bacterium]|nr:tRNA uracil 4-sulfurtransferase ThiI [Acidobacteriota bacterium]
MLKPDTYMLRFGELALKGKNQKLFVDDLIRIIKPRIKKIDGRVEKGHKRLLLHTDASPEDVREAMSTVFGIVGISPIWRTKADMAAIKEVAWTLLEPYKDSGKTFAIRAKRGVKNMPLTSPEIQRQVADHVLGNGLDLPVDLKHADLPLHISLDVKGAWLHLETWKCLGGLPVRPRDRMGLLISGGIDSPVAGNLMQKRGAWLTGIYFHTPPYTVEAAKDKVIELAEVLARYQNKLNLFVVNFTEVMQTIRAECAPAATVVLSRRMMMRAASRIMDRVRGKALITGECLGQVASQTIENIGVIEEGVPYPVLRPLISMDKREIITLSERMGAYDISIRPAQDCCALFSPKDPLTKARVSDMHEQEARLDIDGLIGRALDLTEIIELYPPCKDPALSE